MTGFIKRVLLFSVIIIVGLGILAYVSKKGTTVLDDNDTFDFGGSDGFLAPGTELR